ncbi:MAG: glycosyltransferase [Gemmatimonadota bacterium]|jgi:glycosyltransferase involved in cell wall biosynthesis
MSERWEVDLSILVPVKDEVENIPLLAGEIAEALADTALSWECLWVDDGSIDGSLDALEALRAGDRRHRYLSLDRNYGQSAALMAGLREVRAPVVGTLDADLQNDPRDIPRLLEVLEGGSAEMVSGVRVRRRDRRIRRVASKIANAFRNLVTGEQVTDVGCSIRVFRTRCAQGLPSFRGMHRFIPTLVRLRGVEVAEVAVGHRPRRHGRTKYGIHDRLWVGIADTLGVRWLKARWVEPRIGTRGTGVPVEARRVVLPRSRNGADPMPIRGGPADRRVERP